ncbi:hypothetical protein BDR03DRAFT_971431 [Suillus americanus]|nr:hypothetical protein BDR03DRAFT_971431 [Suillus americanus]
MGIKFLCYLTTTPPTSQTTPILRWARQQACSGSSCSRCELFYCVRLIRFSHPKVNMQELLYSWVLALLAVLNSHCIVSRWLSWCGFHRRTTDDGCECTEENRKLHVLGLRAE